MSLAGGAAPAAGRLRALPAADRHACADPRYPALAGPWVVVCGPDGRVDRAVSLETGAEVDLPVPSVSPGLGPGVVYVPGAQGGAWRLDPGGAVALEGVSRVGRALVAPPATDGTHFAVAGVDAVETFALGDGARPTWSAETRGWQAPAVAGPWVVWVADGPAGGQVWAAQRGGAPPAPLSDAAVDARLPASDGALFYWVEGGALMRWRPGGGPREQVAAGPTGFSAPPTAWPGGACWEERGGGDVDLRCTDGVAVGGPGDQVWPSRYHGWLLYREGGRARLLALPSP